MTGVPTLVARMHESGDPEAAFQAMAESLAEHVTLEAAAWVESGSHGPRCRWPGASTLPRELLEAALRTSEPTIVSPVSSSPGVAGLNPDADALILPLGDAGTGSLVLVAGSGTFGTKPEAWMPLAGALQRIADRNAQLARAEEERDLLRQRAEESEALHVLGMAANRTLDPDEVFDLVARFARTLLGAHYVVVNTVDGERIHSVAEVGLRSTARRDDPLALRIVNSGKPLTIGEDDSSVRVEDLPFHAAEGMRAGIGVPLSLFGETFGALVVGYRRAYPPGPRDVRLALSLAGNAAVAISNARLHRALADRSRELERANEELRWTSEAKERFFASTSHELRTPLNAILGYHSLLLDGVAGELPARVRKYVANANRATQTLLHLVNDILDLSRIEAGKLELTARPTYLGEIIHDAVATVRPLADPKGLRLTIATPQELPLLHTDGDRVRQVLLNLLSNAINFTDSGEVRLSVDPEVRLQGDRPGVRIRVNDTGAGVALEDQERIFHEFEQVVGASSRGGTGLGLPISRKLARLLGGDLFLESTPGQGSTFILLLPLRMD